MKATVYTTSEIAEFNYIVDYASYLPAGHGHKEIFVSVKFDLGNGLYEHKDFKLVTDNMKGIDEADELSGQKQYEALFELVEWKLSGRIAEWISGLDN